MLSIRGAVFSYLAFVSPVIASQRFDARQADNEPTPVVTIASGRLRGKTVQLPDSETTVNQFLGIPFARPPIDDLRFAPPRAPASWDEPYDATSQPPACMQYMGREGPAREMRETLFNDPPPPGENEDCLYLNVYAPSGGADKKAVLFWIYGGSGTAGAASQPIYAGTSFAANHDIVVVAANYRVNIFGQPRAPQLHLEESNLGNLDQRLALEWTQQNIHAFGGDPRKVTVMGESAGAVAVGNFINTYPENPPFRAGVQMSGSSVAKAPEIGSATEEPWPRLIEHLNCPDTSDEGIIECARSVPAETLQQIINHNEIIFSSQPADNVTSLERPDVAWAASNVAKVPLLIGSTADDGSVFVSELASLVEAADLDLAGLLEEMGAKEAMSQLVLQLYGPDSPYAINLSTTTEILYQFATDATFRCTTGFVANLTSTLLDVPVWQYVFDALVPSNTWEDWPDLGVYHASEISLIFGTYPRENSTDVEAELSRSMQKQFADFVKDPEKGPGWDQWPQVGVLGVSETDAVTTTEDVRELDPICQVYNMYYLTQLPALAQMSAGDVGDNGTSDSSEPGGGGREEDYVSAASQPIVSGTGIVGVALLGLYVVGCV